MALSVLGTPFRTFVFTLSGAGLAWLWYESGPVVSLLAVAIVWAIALAFRAYGRSRLPAHPAAAVRWLELQVLEVAAVSAATGAAAIIIAVEFVVPEDAGIATELLTTVSTALTALITSLALEEDKVDSSLGAAARKLFFAAYPVDLEKGEKPVRDGDRIHLSKESPGALAVYSNIQGEISAWERADRHERARRLQEYLDSSPSVTTPVRGGATTTAV